MAEITDLSDLINRCTGGNSGNPETAFFYKDARVGSAAAVATIAGRLTSLFQYTGIPSGPSTAPSLGNPTRASDGALPITNASGGRQKWCLGVSAAPLVAGTLIVYDRLIHGGGLSGTVTTAQACSQAVSRYTSTESAGNQMWVEIYTAIGTTATTATVAYKNQAGTSKTTPSFSIGATGLREAQRLIPIPLAAGDTGVTEITSITLAGTTGTAGDIGITVGRPLIVVPLSLAGCGSIRDLIAGLPGILEIKTDACLSFIWLANTTTAPQVYGSFHTVEK